jgi:hypothetical protein
MAQHSQEGTTPVRKRISRALLTATAAGAAITTVGFMAGTAGASAKPYFTPSAPQTATNANGNATSTNGCGGAGDETGTWTSADCGKTGYVATGRDFRYAQALISVPDHAGSTAADPTMYVSLDGSASNNDYARVGIEPCATAGVGNCSTSHWEAFYDVEQNGTVLGGTATLTTSTEGDGVFVSAYLEPTGNSVHLIVTPPSGSVINTDIQVAGPTYTDAQAFADWTTVTTQPAPVAPGSDKIRDTQFEQGRFTTQTGATGTFSGPWTLHAVDATSNGSLPPSGTLISQPSYLWTSSASYHGLFGDSFGVWRYPF